jgi:hypothetical protein
MTYAIDNHYIVQTIRGPRMYYHTLHPRILSALPESTCPVSTLDSQNLFRTLVADGRVIVETRERESANRRRAQEATNNPPQIRNVCQRRTDVTP